MKRVNPWLLLLLLLSTPVAKSAVGSAAKPNIVYVLCDDLGYGDVHCLNPERGKIPTPNIDRLAAAGMAFTEAHSSSAVCTPTRYGILTGRYNWRTRLQSGVLGGYSPALIAPNRLTVPKLLKQKGYATACIGKWHLGMTMPAQAGAKVSDRNENPSPDLFDLTQIIANGPVTHGFDTFFGISASLDMPPFAFIENDRFTEAPTATKTWVRTGAAAPGFEAPEVLPTLTRKAVDYIGTAKSPFFLYLPLSSPHGPIVPTKEWQGRSGLGSYGDFVMETDWALGEVMLALDKAGIADNTLLVFTSDNGCAPVADIPALEKLGHFPSERRRGYKADIFDGGHRIPFVVRWPGHVKPGSTSDQAICLTDLMATCAEIVGATLPANAGEDSVSLLPVLLGTDRTRVHEAIVHHSVNGSFAIRSGKWKLDLCADSGGWSKPKPGSEAAQKLPPVQLYDMSKDVGERANEVQEHPEIVTELTSLLERYVAQGRTTPGSPQRNDVPIELRKQTKPKRTLARANGD